MFTQVCEGSRKKKGKQNPLCINYNNPTSRGEKKNPCWDQSRKARCNHVSKDKNKKKNTTSLPTQVGKVCQTYRRFTLIIILSLMKICFYPSPIMPLIVCPLASSSSTVTANMNQNNEAEQYMRRNDKRRNSAVLYCTEQRNVTENTVLKFFIGCVAVLKYTLVYN